MSDKKTVLITGGAMGQGRTHAVEFAKKGYDCILLDMLDPTDERFAETIELVKNEGVEVLALKTNICSTEEMEAAFATAWETFGRLDVVVANAGIINFGYTWDLTDEAVEKALAVNLEGTWRTDKYAARYMREQGYGRIINISSVSGLKGTEQLATYCMTKFGIIGLTKTVAKELGSRNITSNAIAPGFIETAMTDVLSDKVKAELNSHISLRRLGKAEDVARLMVFLASDAGSYISGQVIGVDGCMSI